jgi:hypothetical protein
MHSIVPGRSRTLGRVSRRVMVALLVGIAVLMTAAVAIAAHPKRGAHFAGTASGPPINGFAPPVTFTVSPSGKTLTRFAYSTIGCFGAGGFRPGIDYYAQPGAIIKVGTVKVSGSGHFSATGAVSAYTSHGVTTTTTTKVTGSFTSSKAASGVVTFSQRLSGSYTSSCGPATRLFTAKARGH